MYTYGDRGIYTGPQLEEYLAGLGINDKGKRYARGLFRFANREDLRSCQTGMEYVHNGQWLIDHPMKVIDGMNYAQKKDGAFSSRMHLDLFAEPTLISLQKIVDLNNPLALASWDEGRMIRGEIPSSIEGNNNFNKEL